MLLTKSSSEYEKQMRASTYQDVVIRITDSQVMVEASINYNLKMSRPLFYNPEDLVYQSYPTVILTGECFYPKKLNGNTFTITLYGKEIHKGNLAAILDDFHKRGEYNTRVYKKYHGIEYPVMEEGPKGIGTYHKVRGEPCWESHMWLGREFVSDVLATLNLKQEMFIYLSKTTEKRTHWIHDFSVTSKNPLDDIL